MTSNQYVTPRSGGMSYIEIIVAQLLVAIAITGLIKLHTHISVANRESIKVSGGINLAHNLITELRSNSFGGVNAGARQEFYQSIYYELDWTSEIAYFDSRHINSNKWNAESAYDMEAIEIGQWIHVSVSWLNERDIYERINITSFIRKN